MKDIDAIIFDMDGVIVDTEPLHMESGKKTCQEFGLHVPDSEWELFKGRRVVDLFKDAIRSNKCDLDPECMAERSRKIFLDFISFNMPIVPGSVDFIRRVRERGSKIALATSTHATVQRKIFELLDLAPLFDVITTGDEIEHGKPDPEPYAKTVAKLGLHPSRCAVIEDSDNGIRSAKAAGCVAIGITTTFPRKVLFECGADSVGENFEEISTFFNP